MKIILSSFALSLIIIITKISTLKIDMQKANIAINKPEENIISKNDFEVDIRSKSGNKRNNLFIGNFFIFEKQLKLKFMT